MKIRLPAPWLQTLRLELREFVASDQDDIWRLDQDPAVMRYINGGQPTMRAQVAARMKLIPRVYRLYPGFGTWRAARRDTGAYIGPIGERADLREREAAAAEALKRQGRH